MGLLNKFRKQRVVSLEEEVADHLGALLNTKRGFGTWQKDFGVDNYANYHSKDEAVRAIQADIALNIEKFEKRIQLLEIFEIQDGDLFHYRFVIKCRIGSRFHSYYVGFKKGKSLVEIGET